jgi:tetratricopeptide (TPR) repeat protein
VDFWEEHYDELYRLPLDKYFDLLNTYARALFELGKYKKFLNKVDEILSVSFEYNLSEWEGHDIVTYTLVKKAAAHFHLYELQKAQIALKQVLTLKPEHKTARHLLERCLHRQKKSKKQVWRAITIVLFLAAALTVPIELFVLRPFILQWTEPVEYFRIGLFTGGLGLWAGAETLQWLSVKSKCNKIISQLGNNGKDGDEMNGA